MMKRSILSLLLTALALFSGCDTTESREREFQVRGKAAVRFSLQGNYEQAAKEAVSLADDFPSSSQAQFLAAFYLGKQAYEVESHPFSDSTVRKIRGYLDWGFALGSPDTETEWGAALLYASLGSSADAMRIFRRLEENESFLSNKERLNSIAEFSYLIARSGDPSGALEMLNSSLVANPGHDMLAQEKVALLAEFFSLDSAETFAKEFEKQYGYHAKIQYQVCSSYVFHRRKDEARKCLNELNELPDLNSEERETILSDLQTVEDL